MMHKITFSIQIQTPEPKKVYFTLLGIEPFCALWDIICILQLFAIQLKWFDVHASIIFVS